MPPELPAPPPSAWPLYQAPNWETDKLIMLEGRDFIEPTNEKDVIRCRWCYVGFRLAVSRAKMLERAINHMCLKRRRPDADQ
jgi:hypothetical protein